MPRLGYGPIKINAVAVKNLVEPDIVPLARFGRERGIEIRYIEFMPLDSQGMWDRDRVLLADDMIAMLEREIGPLEEIPDRDPRAPATEYRFADGIGRVGFIASVSRPFCLNCNRIRLTSDGKLRYCLFAIEETDVRALLRDGGTDDDIRDGRSEPQFTTSGSATRSIPRNSSRPRGRCIPSAAEAIPATLVMRRVRDTRSNVTHKGVSTMVTISALRRVRLDGDNLLGPHPYGWCLTAHR